MEIGTVANFQVSETTDASHVRRTAVGIADRLGFSAEETHRLAIIVTELATNVLKHAERGELVIQNLAPRPGSAARGIGVLALDRGPGISDLRQSLRDGYSTAGTAGTGLGAVRRLASTFEVYSQPERGVAILAELWGGGQVPAAGAFDLGALSVAKHGEPVCGDAWGASLDGSRLRVILADGLGHGEAAATAALAAVAAFKRHPNAGLTAVLEAVHGALRATRGAAVGIADVDRASRRVRFAGVGNISGVVVSPPKDSSMVSHNGTMGHELRKIQEFEYPWPEHAIMVLHSDGLSSRWDLKAHAGLSARSPLLIAGVLFRDCGRERDDATVIVVKDRPAGGAS